MSIKKKKKNKNKNLLFKSFKLKVEIQIFLFECLYPISCIQEIYGGEGGEWDYIVSDILYNVVPLWYRNAVTKC